MMTQTRMIEIAMLSASWGIIAMRKTTHQNINVNYFFTRFLIIPNFRVRYRIQPFVFCILSSALSIPSVQAQPASINYGGAGFTENPANDGSVSGSITATLSGDTFTANTLTVPGDVALGKIPTGLNPTIGVEPAGATWTPQAAAEASGWNSVTYGDGQFVAVAHSGTNRVMTSPGQ